MSEVSSIHFTNSLIPSADQLNTPQRKGAADISQLIQDLVMGGVAVPAAGVVIGGLLVTGKANDMRVDVAAGLAGLYDSGAVSPEHPFRLIMVRDDDVSPALNDGDSTDPRIDVISITPEAALLDSEPVLQIGGGTTNVATRRGPGYTINVTEGTPDPSPVAPGTPTGAIKVAEVLVPAGLTAGGGGTASATITDYRNHRGLIRRGPFDGIAPELHRYVATWSGGRSLMILQGAPGLANGLIEWRGDMTNHWPAWRRLDEPAGDETGDLYPMVIAGNGDREHWLTAPFNAGDPSDADASVNVQGFGALQYGGVRVDHLTGSATTVRASVMFLTPARGASFNSYRLKYEIYTAAPATLAARAVVYDADADAIVNLSDLTNLPTSVATHDEALDNPIEFTPDEGDIVGIRIEIGFAAAADNAAIECRTGSAAIREGRAV